MLSNKNIKIQHLVYKIFCQLWYKLYGSNIFINHNKMKHISILLFVLITSTFTYGQVSLNNIDFQAPLGGNLSQNSTLSLGVTLKLPERDRMLELGLLGFGDNGRNYTSGIGAYSTFSYFDSASNTFTTSERPKYRLNYGDSVLKQYQSTSRDAIGLRIGLRKDYNYAKILFYTSVSASLIGARTRYQRSESYERYDSSSTNLGQFENSFPPTNLSNQNTFSFIPQGNAQLGVVLSLNERIKVIPKVSANITYSEYFAFNTNGATSTYRTLDLSTAASFQVSYLLKK